MGVERSVPGRFAQVVAQGPERVALIHGGEQWTYRELSQRADQVAQRLLQGGLAAEQRVGLCLAPSLELVAALLGVLRAGGALVPLDPGYPAERLDLLVADSGLARVVTTSALAPRFAGKGLAVVELDRPVPEAEPCPFPEPRPDHLAVCLYTSGSTGRPKGVLIEHQGLVDHCLAMQPIYGLGPADRGLLFASLNYVAALEQLFLPLLTGAALVVREPELWGAADFPAKVRAYGITVADLPPGYLHALLEGWGAAGTVDGWPLRLVIVGGEALRPQTVALWQRSPLRTARLMNAYGMTETPVTAVLYEVPADEPLDRVPIGRPLPHWRVRLLDEAAREVGPGEVGEIAIGGPGLARGYLDQPELTAERFIADPAGEGRLYRTGDRGRFRPDGVLDYLGRKDHQVQIRGHRVELGEIEAALAAHPQVGEATVVAQGEGAGKRLVAFVVPRAEGRDAANGLTATLRRHLLGKLPAPMVPDRVVLLERMLLTPNGKVDRQALAAHGRRHEAFRVQLSGYGSLDNLTLAPFTPRAPGPGEVVIETHAASLNFRDALNALGMLREYNAVHLGIERAEEVPFGFECAGVIGAVGEGVTGLRVGDAVVAYTLGGLASQVVVDARHVALKPPAMGFAEAASLPTVFLTAYYGLTELARVRPGERVLVHSAAGGVGQAAVQVARAAGAEVIATASPGKWAFLREQGIAQVMNSRTLEFADAIAAQGGVDIVLNSLNGEFIDKSFAVLKPGGRFIELGKLGIWSPQQVAGQRPDVAYFAFDLGDVIDAEPERVARMLAAIFDGFERGAFTPLPIRTFPIDQVVEAFRHIAQARHIGKVVLSFTGETLAVIPEPQTAEERPVTPPQTPTEQRIAALWQRVLGIGACDTRSSFFEQGGNSLLALELTGRLAATLGVPITMQALLEHDTVERLGRWVDQWVAEAPAYEEGVL